MKFLFRSELPPLDRSATVPIILAGLLSATLAFQAMLVGDPVLPPIGPLADRRLRLDAAPSETLATGITIANNRSIFAPGSPPPAGGPNASPLGDVMIAGSIRNGRSLMAVVQGPGDRVSNVLVGGRIGDWRLKAVREKDALLVRGHEQISVPFGARGFLPATAAETRIDQ